MVDLAKQLSDSPDPDVQRVLKQAARETLLMQSSDWQFLISTWSARDYAELRFDYHYQTFQRLSKLLKSMAVGIEPTAEDWTFVEECEARDAVFADIDPHWWAKYDGEPAT